MWLHNCGQLKLSASNQKPETVLAEFRREFYLRKLLKLAVVGIILGVVFLLFWSAVTTPRFDENYVRSLLTRHDPTIAGDVFERHADIEAGEELVASSVSDDASGYVIRDAIITVGVSGDRRSVVSGEITMVGTPKLDIGTINRSFSCPNSTWLNISLHETDSYLYMGTVGNWVTLVAFTSIGEDTEQRAAAAASSGLNATFPDAKTLTESAKNLYTSQIFYFNPSEREAYEQNIGQLTEIASACEEVRA
jgi:hypothetical protein